MEFAAELGHGMIMALASNKQYNTLCVLEKMLVDHLI